MDITTPTQGPDLLIPEFGVTIPFGSNSYRIERALRDSTKELNAARLTVNKKTWKKNTDAMGLELAILTDEVRKEIGDPLFRPNASADCAALLFDKMGLQVVKKTKATGKASVDKETLEILAGQGHKIASMISRAREARSKLSQLEAWKQYADRGYVQADWNQFGTPHGRYTCENPNLQNRINEVRETIEAPEGEVLVSSDLGQAEYVTWASLSEDPVLSKAFLEDTDFHRRMWEEIKVVAPDIQVLEENERKSGKTINFALLYLMKEFTLAGRLGVPVVEVRKIYEAYEERAPTALKYQRDYVEKASQDWTAETAFGRKRKLSVPQDQKHNPRQNSTHEMQKTLWHHHNAGTAAEILKFKQARLHKRIREQGLKAKLVLQMHDQLIYSAPEDEAERTGKLLDDEMKATVKGFLPFASKLKIAKNWLQIQQD